LTPLTIHVETRLLHVGYLLIHGSLDEDVGKVYRWRHFFWY